MDHFPWLFRARILWRKDKTAVLSPVHTLFIGRCGSSFVSVDVAKSWEIALSLTRGER